jgi:hypothetical protein
MSRNGRPPKVSDVDLALMRSVYASTRAARGIPKLLAQEFGLSVQYTRALLRGAHRGAI